MSETPNPVSATSRVRHITITGDLGSGKSTVAELVAKKIGSTVVSTGTLQRSIAASLSLSTLETNLLAEKDRAIDTQVDGYSAELAANAESTIVFDSRMAWHIVPDSFKVRMLVDPEVAVERVVDRSPDESEKYLSVEDARQKIRDRYSSEVRRFIARYGVDITSLRHFDLVIDTSDIGPDEAARLIVDHFASAEGSAATILASPRRILPAFSSGVEVRSGAGVSVVYSRPFLVAVSGEDDLARSIREHEKLIPVHVVAEGEEMVETDVSALTFAEHRVSQQEVVAWERQNNVEFAGFHAWRSAS